MYRLVVLFFTVCFCNGNPLDCTSMPTYADFSRCYSTQTICPANFVQCNSPSNGTVDEYQLLYKLQQKELIVRCTEPIYKIAGVCLLKFKNEYMLLFNGSKKVHRYHEAIEVPRPREWDQISTEYGLVAIVIVLLVIFGIITIVIYAIKRFS